MVLSDFEIELRCMLYNLVVAPEGSYEEHPEIYGNSIQPASYDLRLGAGFKYPKPSVELSKFDEPVEYITDDSDEFILFPQHFVLGTTMETINLPADVAAFVEGRSSIGRMGLFIQNAGFADPGFSGQITLELYNASDRPILLKAGHRIGQLVFFELNRPADHPYNGKYQNQVGTTESRKYQDEDLI